eukprot:jgi/Tetstr1/434613/TSEL_023704.t1
MLVSEILGQQGAISYATNDVISDKTKHIDVIWHFVKDHVEACTIRVNYIAINLNTADMMTEPLPRAALEKYVRFAMGCYFAHFISSSSSSSAPRPLLFPSCEALSYQDAVDYCAATYPNGGLAAPLAALDISALQSLLLQECPNSVSFNYVWAGFFIDESNVCFGTTFISFGTCLPPIVDQIIWADGQPDGPEVELCLALSVSNDGSPSELSDLSCETKLPFVCQVYALNLCSRLSTTTAAYKPVTQLTACKPVSSIPAFKPICGAPSAPSTTTTAPRAPVQPCPALTPTKPTDPTTTPPSPPLSAELRKITTSAFVATKPTASPTPSSSPSATTASPQPFTTAEISTAQPTAISSPGCIPSEPSTGATLRQQGTRCAKLPSTTATTTPTESSCKPIPFSAAAHTTLTPIFKAEYHLHRRAYGPFSPSLLVTMDGSTTSFTVAFHAFDRRGSGGSPMAVVALPVAVAAAPVAVVALPMAVAVAPVAATTLSVAVAAPVASALPMAVAEVPVASAAPVVAALPVAVPAVPVAVAAAPVAATALPVAVAAPVASALPVAVAAAPVAVAAAPVAAALPVAHHEPYNGLVSDIEVRVVEVRSVGLLVNPSPVELLAADGGVGTFTVALTSDPLAPVTITFTDASGQLVFAPASIEVSPGLNSVTAQSVTGRQLLAASLGAQGQAILLSRSELSLEEGGEAVYQVALATPPLEEVTVSIGLTWTDGQPRNIVFEPANITFPAGEATDLTKRQHERDRSKAAGSWNSRFSDSDAVGVCLGGCKNYTPYELFFVDGDQGVPTPYEVVAGTADLKFPSSLGASG